MVLDYAQDVAQRETEPPVAVIGERVKLSD